jgi:hypothetical protein
MVAHIPAYSGKGVITANHEERFPCLSGGQQPDIVSHLLPEGTHSLAGREDLLMHEIGIRIHIPPGGFRLGSKLGKDLGRTRPHAHAASLAELMVDDR